MRGAWTHTPVSRTVLGLRTRTPVLELSRTVSVLGLSQGLSDCLKPCRAGTHTRRQHERIYLFTPAVSWDHRIRSVLRPVSLHTLRSASKPQDIKACWSVCRAHNSWTLGHVLYNRFGVTCGIFSRVVNWRAFVLHDYASNSGPSRCVISPFLLAINTETHISASLDCWSKQWYMLLPIVTCDSFLVVRFSVK